MGKFIINQTDNMVMNINVPNNIWLAMFLVNGSNGYVPKKSDG